MHTHQLLATVLLTAVSTASAQSAATPQQAAAAAQTAAIARAAALEETPLVNTSVADKKYAALHPTEAFSYYKLVVAALPNGIDGLWKASRTAVLLGAFADSITRDTLYKAAETYGRRAVKIDSVNAMAQYGLAQALGQIALSITDPQKRLPYAQETYQHATACLKLNPTFAECAHVLGVWNAEVMRTDAGLRARAINTLGAQELTNASWTNAQKYLQQAVDEQPGRAVHHLELARVYADMGEKAKAKTEYQAVLQASIVEYNDEHYKAAVQKALRDLGNN